MTYMYIIIIFGAICRVLIGSNNPNDFFGQSQERSSAETNGEEQHHAVNIFEFHRQGAILGLVRCLDVGKGVAFCGIRHCPVKVELDQPHLHSDLYQAVGVIQVGTAFLKNQPISWNLNTILIPDAKSSWGKPGMP